MISIRKISLVVTITLLAFNVSGQKQNPDSLLEANTANIPALNELVSISVSNTPIQEFMRGVANSSGLNIDVDPGMDIKIINNFSNVKVKDILAFVSRQYNLDIYVIGNIITVTRTPEIINPNVSVVYNPTTDLVSIDVSNETLAVVAREITARTGKNILAKPNARDEKISIFIKEMPFEAAVEKLASSNGLSMSKSQDGFYIVDKTITAVASQDFNQGESTRTRSTRSESNRSNGNQSKSGDYTLDIRIIDGDSISVKAENAPVGAILSELANKVMFSYFVSPAIEDLVTGTASGRNLNDILNYLFNGTKVAFKQIQDVYIVGEKKLIDYNDHRVIKLQNRSMEKILDFLPKDLTESLQVIEFIELNSLLVTGPTYQIDELDQFIKKIDLVVPVVLIEVIIMYVNNTYTVSTGIQAGIGNAPKTTGGTIFPNVDLSIGSGKINEILNGAGWINLGKVTPNFYVTLQAMETQGLIDMQSTPKLSTLNGHEATMSIGNTEYYLEEQTQLFGTQIPQQTTTESYKAVNAELSVKIKPVVSGDEQITLEIEVKQSDFTERISKTAPPGTVNRNFTSQIRVKNQEMILLGGLMDNRASDSGSGTPLLSRIPVIKWFFSSRKHENSNSKLSILIRPTIIN